MDNREQVQQEIVDYVKREFLEDEDEELEVTAETPLISSGIVDSFSMVSLRTFLEKKYSVQIPDAKATPEAFDSIGGIIDLLSELGA